MSSKQINMQSNVLVFDFVPSLFTSKTRQNKNDKKKKTRTRSLSEAIMYISQYTRCFLNKINNIQKQQ